MKTNTLQSFFPTTAKTSCQKYILIKKATLKRSEDTFHRHSNIFKNAELDTFYEFDHKFEKPVGGMATFKKYNASSRLSKSDFLGSKDAKKSKAKESNYKNGEGAARPTEGKEEELFKEHKAYQTCHPKQKGKEKRERPFTSASCGKNSQDWAKKQALNFNNKMAYLNEIYYKKPTEERYGDRYFEYSLRNRFEEDIPPPPYIYQIDSGTHAQVESSKFIFKLMSKYSYI